MSFLWKKSSKIYFHVLCRQFWTTKIISVFDTVHIYMREMQFLRLDVNYYYNKNINSVGISYQLLDQFKINYRVWKYKWIWEIFWWSRGLLVLNAYVIYNTDCELNSVSPMRHYKFWRRIALRNIYQKRFRGRYHLSSAEPHLGVLNHKESTASVC